MACVVYCRVSSEDQQERKTIDNQIEFANKYADLHGIKISEFYKDDGVTGTIPLDERPEGARLIEDIEDGKINEVLIYKIDRFGRTARVVLNGVHQLEKKGIKLKSMTEPFDTGDPFGRFVVTMLAGFADLDRETTLSKLWHGQNKAAREGKWIGGIVPYGYRVNENRFLEINEDCITGCEHSEADIIRIIYHLLCKEKFSTIKIANFLNALGIPPSYQKDDRIIKKGKRKGATAGIWRPGRIRNMIINPTYKGTHIYGKRTNKDRELITREVPAIVSEELWEEAQNRLVHNRIVSTKNSKNTYLLRGLIKCDNCGSTYSGITYNNGPYYKCLGKNYYQGKLLGKCESKNIPAKWLEELVWNNCLSFISNPGETLNEIANSMQSNEDQKEELLKEKNNLMKSMDRKEEERQNILSLYRKQIIDSKDVEIQLSIVDADKKSIEDRSTTIKERLEAKNDINKLIVNAEELLRHLNDKTKNEIDTETKKEVINLLVDRIRVSSTNENDNLQAEVQISFSFTNTANCTFTDSCYWRK